MQADLAKKYLGHYYYHDDFKRTWWAGKKKGNGEVSESIKGSTQEGVRKLIEKKIRKKAYEH